MTDPTSPANIPGLQASAVLPQPGNLRLAVLDPAPQADEPEADYGGPARFARTLNAQQLDIALDYMFRLDDCDDDLPVIADIRASHPESLAAAEKITQWNLGSPRELRSRALDNFRDSPAGSDLRSAPAVWPWRLSLALCFTAPAAACLALTMSAGTVLAAGFAGALTCRMLWNKPLESGLPKIQDSDWDRLHQDVVDAVLESILSRRGVLTPGQSEALRRGYDHLSFIAHTTAAMAVAPYRPAPLAETSEAA